MATICLDMYPVQRYLGEQEQKLQISTHTNFLVCFEMVSHIAHRQILNSQQSSCFSLPSAGITEEGAHRPSIVWVFPLT